MKKILLVVTALFYVFSASFALAKTEKSNPTKSDHKSSKSATTAKSDTPAKTDKVAKKPVKTDNDSEEEYNLLEGEVEGQGN